MKKQLRIVLTHKENAPTREELSATERSIGEAYFKSFDLQWGGWIIQTDSFKQSVQWLAKYEDLDLILALIRETDGIPGHTIGISIVDDEEAEEQELLSLNY